MKKYHKISIFIVLFALMVTLLAVPASAEASFEALPISVTKLWSNNVDNNTYIQYESNYVNVQIPYHASKSQFASIWTFNNNDTTNYYDYKFVFTMVIIEPSNFSCTLNGVSYEVKKHPDYVNTFYIEIGQVKLSTTQGRLDFDFTWSAATSGNMYVQAYYRLSDVNAILDNQNENTDKIIENQNENTDKIVGTFTEGDYNDWSDTQNTVDDYNETEKVIIDVANENLTTVKGNIFDNSLFSPDNKFFKGFIAMSGVVEKFSILPGVDGVLKYSIAFGIMAFVLGLITTVVRVRRK